MAATPRSTSARDGMQLLLAGADAGEDGDARMESRPHGQMEDRWKRSRAMTGNFEILDGRRGQVEMVAIADGQVEIGLLAPLRVGHAHEEAGQIASGRLEQASRRRRRARAIERDARTLAPLFGKRLPLVQPPFLEHPRIQHGAAGQSRDHRLEVGWIGAVAMETQDHRTEQVPQVPDGGVHGLPSRRSGSPAPHRATAPDGRRNDTNCPFPDCLPMPRT